MNYKNFPMVPRIVFGRGAFNQLPDILSNKRIDKAPFIYMVDECFSSIKGIVERIELKYRDEIIFVSTEKEPETIQIDNYVKLLKEKYNTISGVIGIGGGTTMDVAKAIALMFTNTGETSEYQGWDLIKNPGIYHVGIPTISGTGAEVSRTTVLLGPVRKLGLNSDYTTFDQIILDSSLTSTVEKNQWFFTGMDCYIHCIESLTGTFLNTFSKSYGEMALELCRKVFLESDQRNQQSEEDLMMASYHGGMSIAYSQVGVCHALSYGLSFVLGTHHGVGNCIVFDKLEKYYPEGVEEFRNMVAKHQIEIPQNICKNLKEEQLDKMASVAWSLTPLWENALGLDWENKISISEIKNLYKLM